MNIQELQKQIIDKGVIKMIDAEEVINKIKDDKYYTYEELTVVLNYIDKLKEENRKLRNCHFRYEEMTGIDLLLEE